MLDNVKALLDSPLCAEHGLQPYALIMVANRLAVPWQLIRLAVKAAESDDAARIAATPYALAVTITLGDIERMVEELKADLKRGAPSPSPRCSNASTMPRAACAPSSICRRIRPGRASSPASAARFRIC